MERIGLGIIGCGMVSKRHLTAAQNVAGVHVVAACNRSRERLDERCDEFGVERRCDDVDSLLADPDIEAVIICLPEGLHRDVTLAAAAAGKHLLVEKPMSRTVAEADEMLAAAEAAGVTLMVGQVVRCFPSHVWARRIIRDGGIGRVRAVYRRRLFDKPGDLTLRPWQADADMCPDWLLYAFGSHEYDALRWLIGADAPQNVQAAGTYWEAPDGWGQIASVMQFDDVTASLVMSCRARPEAWDTVIVGSERTLTVGKEYVAVDDDRIETPLDIWAAFADQLHHFAECIRTGAEPDASGRDVRQTMVLLEAVHTALNRNG